MNQSCALLRQCERVAEASNEQRRDQTDGRREKTNVATLEPRAEAESEYLRLVVGLFHDERRQVDVDQPERRPPGDADADADARRAEESIDRRAPPRHVRCTTPF